MPRAKLKLPDDMFWPKDNFETENTLKVQYLVHPLNPLKLAETIPVISKLARPKPLPLGLRHGLLDE